MGDDNTFDKHTAFGIVQSLEFSGTFAMFDECIDHASSVGPRPFYCFVLSTTYTTSTRTQTET